MDAANAGLMFVICLLLGTGIGLLFGSLEMGGWIGLGAGLVSVAVFRKR